MTKVEAAVQFMEDLAADDSHGYSQQNRWGPDYDCSSAIISAWQYAGVPVKDKGATFTGNMLTVFLSCGFYDVTADVNLKNGNGMRPGDVLLNDVHHTAMYIGNGRLVAARSDEGHPEPGDQGREICEQNYYNFPWDHCLRYPQDAPCEDDTEENPGKEEKDGLAADGICGPSTWSVIGDLIKKMPMLSYNQDTKKGSIGWNVTMLQAFLNFYGADLDADGEYGPLTKKAVLAFQKNH